MSAAAEFVPRQLPRRVAGTPGNGHRVPAPVQAVVRRKLAETIDLATGEVPDDVIRWAMVTANTTRRTIQRYAMQERVRLGKKLLGQAPADSGEDDLLGIRSLAVGARPKFRMTRELLKEVSEYPSPAKAWDTLHDDPTHVLSRVSRSTFYEALDECNGATRHAVKRGVDGMRAREMHTQRLRHITRVNESWSIDEFDAKVDVLVGGRLVQPKVLSFIDEAEGLVVGYTALQAAAASDDVCALFASSVIGWEADGVKVSGAPLYIHSDQGGPLIGDGTRRRVAFCGTALDPGASRRPQHNGGHERFQRTLLEELKKVRGSRRAPKDRAGEDYDDGVATWDEFIAALDAAMGHMRFVHRPKAGRHPGRTAFEVYREKVAAGDVARLDVEAAGIAECAMPLGTRKNEPRKGVYVRGEYYTGYGLAVWNRHAEVEVRVLPGNPALAFVFDTDGTFISRVWHPDHLPDDEAWAIVTLSETREKFWHAAHSARAKKRAAGGGPKPADDAGVSVMPLAPTDTATTTATVAALADADALRELLSDPAVATVLRGLLADNDSATPASDDADDGAPPAPATASAAAPDGAAATTTPCTTRQLADILNPEGTKQ